MVDPATASTASAGLKVSEVLTFISSMASALAWPVAAFLIVNLFKKEIIAKIPLLSELTLPGGLSAKFNKDLAQLVTATEQRQDSSQPDIRTTSSEQGPDVSTIEEGATATDAASATVTPPEPDIAALSANPNGIVMESWVNLELALRELAKSASPPLPVATKHGLKMLIQQLTRAGLLNIAEVQTLDKLMQLRNIAAHTVERISEEDALRFKQLADDLAGLYRLRAAGILSTPHPHG